MDTTQRINSMLSILYISGLNKKRRKYDGERIKNTIIFKSLKKKYKVSLINLSVFKIINTVRIFLNALFLKRRYDYVVISKDPHGANIIHKLLKLAKYPSNKIVYFEIGPFLYDRILNGSIKIETFASDKMIVVETPSMKKELESLGFNNIDVFPNFKPEVEIDFLEKKYPMNILELVFLSRIEEKKGLYDLIETLALLNSKEIRFRLSIYGRIQSKEDADRLHQYLTKYNFLEYKGKLDVGSADSYRELSKYDLHTFPTKYTEGFPGSLIDFFIAGVPTISSSFARAHEILSENDSIIYEQFDNDDLYHKLEYIYHHQELLNKLRKKSFEKRKQYSVASFENYLDEIL